MHLSRVESSARRSRVSTPNLPWYICILMSPFGKKQSWFDLQGPLTLMSWNRNLSRPGRLLPLPGRIMLPHHHNESHRVYAPSLPSFLPFYFRVCAFSIQRNRTRLSRSLEKVTSGTSITVWWNVFNFCWWFNVNCNPKFRFKRQHQKFEETRRKGRNKHVNLNHLDSTVLRWWRYPATVD